MKGYIVDSGYMGFVDGRYELFATEDDYLDFMAAQVSLHSPQKELHCKNTKYIYGDIAYGTFK